MKTIGLIGGMSWESTLLYYRIINEVIRDREGGLHSAKVILYSVDFEEISRLQDNDEWEKCSAIIGCAAQVLEEAGADFIVICSNTMHKVAEQIASMIEIPLLNIADAAAGELEKRHISRIGLLGTKYTMLHDFYRRRLSERGIDVLLPSWKDIEAVNSIIFNELCIGRVREKSRRACLDIIDRLKQGGAEAVVLGCTELGLLIDQAASSIPIFDTTVIHAEKAAELALKK